MSVDGRRATSARLAVADTGIGIAAADQERLFERFHRVVDARSRTHEGSGIGLALVAELAALHGGSVEVESEPGARQPLRRARAARRGAGRRRGRRTTTSSIERFAASYVAEALRWLEPGDEETVDDGGERPLVLVVDDNADMRAYVASLLSERVPRGDGARRRRRRSSAPAPGRPTSC